MQEYLKRNYILTFQEQKEEEKSYRSAMNEFNFNFEGLKDDETCVCTIKLNNPYIFQCKILNNFVGHEFHYQYISNGVFHQQKHILNIMKTNITNYRKMSLAA